MYTVSRDLKENIHKFQQEDDLFTALYVLFSFQHCSTFPPVFMNVFFFQVEANTVQMCCHCFYSAVMANSKIRN